MAFVGRYHFRVTLISVCSIVGSVAFGVRAFAIELGRLGFELMRATADVVMLRWRFPPLRSVTDDHGPCSDYDGPAVAWTRYEAGRRTLAAARGV